MSTNKNDPFFARLLDLFQNGVGVARKVKGNLDYKPSLNNYGYRTTGQKSTAFGGIAKKNTRNTFNNTMNPSAVHRFTRYQEYEAMEEMAEINTALTVMAAETCAVDDKGKCFHIHTDNERINELLSNLFYDILNIEFNLYWWVRSLCKTGDFVLYNRVDPKIGITGVSPIPINEVERDEDFDPQTPELVKFNWQNQTLEAYQITHMRLIGNEAFLPFGTSMIEGARRAWRQLLLAEDSMLVYRVVRSPERRVFYIDVANIPGAEVGPYMEQMKNALKGSQVIDPTSGRADYRYSAYSQEEDFYIPMRGSDSATKIDTLAGGENTTATDDVEYLQRKLFSALHVPKAFLGYDESLSSKSTLALQDVRFSRTVAMIQKVILAELNKLAMIHLFAHGFSGEDLVNFDLQLSNPSTIAQQQKLELLRSRLEILKNNYDPEQKLLSREFFLRNIMNLSESEIETERARIEEDKKFDARIEAVETKLGRGGVYSDNFDGGTYGYKDGKQAATDPSLPPDSKTDASASPEDSNSTTDSQPAGFVVTKPSNEDDSEILRKTNGDKPLKPQNQVAYNRSRRRTHGADALATPDFKAMFSRKNVSLKDIYDKNFLGRKDPFSENFDPTDDIFDEELPPVKTVSSPTITKEIQQMLKTMDEQLNISRQWSSANNGLLAENKEDEFRVNFPLEFKKDD